METVNQFIHFIDHTQAIEAGKSYLTSPDGNYALTFSDGNLVIKNTRAIQDEMDGMEVWTFPNENDYPLQKAEINWHGYFMVTATSGETKKLPAKLPVGSNLSKRLFLENNGRLILASMEGEEIYTILWDTWQNPAWRPVYEVYAAKPSQVYCIGGEVVRKLLLTYNGGLEWAITGSSYDKISILDNQGLVTQTNRQLYKLIDRPDRTSFGHESINLKLRQHQQLSLGFFLGLDNDDKIHLFSGEGTPMATMEGRFRRFSVEHPASAKELFWDLTIFAINKDGNIVIRNLIYPEINNHFQSKLNLPDLSAGKGFKFTDVSAIGGPWGWAIRYNENDKKHELVKIHPDSFDKNLTFKRLAIKQIDFDSQVPEINNSLNKPEFIRVSAINSNVYAISKDYLLWRSMDNGDSWSLVLTEVNKANVKKLKASMRTKADEDGIEAESNCMILKIELNHASTIALITSMIKSSSLMLKLKFLPFPIPQLLAATMISNGTIIGLRYKGHKNGITFNLPWILLTPAIGTGAAGVSVLMQACLTIN